MTLPSFATPPATPFELFSQWMQEADKSEPNDPCAACLATVDAWGQPNARMVLVRIIDERGFTFFTNASSRKGQELAAVPKAALCFHWKTLRQSVRVQGDVTPATAAESDAYFNSRHPSSRIGAWASLQSQKLSDRSELLERFAMFEQKFSRADEIPRPEHWHGFRIVPNRIEFWKDGEHRLHDRLVYIRNGSGWEKSLLYP